MADKGNEYFCRYEKKYLADVKDAEGFFKEIGPMIEPDLFAVSEVSNCYYDTPDYLLIRRSLQKPYYKEKLRVRCYETPKDDTTTFIELKKKFEKVVYKRRLELTYADTMALLSGKREPVNQIEKEVMYMFQLYPGLSPRMAIFYHRESWRGIEDPNLRITIDSNIRWREDDPDIRNPEGGYRILPDNVRLIELKVHGSMPLWLVHAMTNNNIKPASFSKYGNGFLRCEHPDYFNYISGGYYKI